MPLWPSLEEVREGFILSPPPAHEFPFSTTFFLAALGFGFWTGMGMRGVERGERL